MLTDEQRKELTELHSQYADGLIAASEAGLAISAIVFPREMLAQSVEAALLTRTWRDFDHSIRPQVDQLFTLLLK